MAKPSKFLLDIENYLGLGPTKTARVLGIAYPTYAAYRSMSRELPEYHANQVHMLKMLDGRSLKSYLEGKF